MRRPAVCSMAGFAPCLAQWRWGLALVLGCVAWSEPAAALQPLDVFLEGASRNNPDYAGAVAEYAQRDEEAKVTRWKLAPSLSAEGSYTRNQYERAVMFPGSTEPQAFFQINQWDASVVLSVPLVNVGAWEQTQASNAMVAAAAAGRDAVAFELERRVVRAYYQLLASDAVFKAAQKSLALAESNAEVVRDKRTGGVATELEMQRALADVARAQQDVAVTELAVTTARRQLSSASGIEPQAVEAFRQDDLQPEPPLEAWLESTDSVPTVKVAQANRVAADRSIDAARGVWYPTLTGTAQERYSNATALMGHKAYYAFKVSLAWRLDGTTLHASRAREAAAAVARSRADRSRQDAADAIYLAWHQVHAGLDRARASRAQAQATARAADLAHNQYVAGVATQLDVLAARDGAFRAEVARIQADADLAYNRAALRLYAGKRPEGDSGP